MAEIIYCKSYKEILETIKNKRFFIFGQSERAMVFYLAAKLDGQEEGFASFVLSDLRRCKYKVPAMMGHPVHDIQWLKEQKDIKCGFIAARSSVVQSELRGLFADLDMTLYYIDEETHGAELGFLTGLLHTRIRNSYYARTDYLYAGNLRLSENPGGHDYMYLPKMNQGVWPDSDWLDHPNLDMLHEAQFGAYERLTQCDNDSFNPKCKIYMAKTVFDRPLASDICSENTVVIQGGADLTFERIGMYHDNEGENISKRNRDYCEMTSVYWAWKNDHESEYIGLCHYRRRFIMNKNMINSMIENNYDLVMTTPYLENNTVYEEFCTQNWFLDQQEWDSITEAIDSVAPDYFDAWKELADSHIFLPCNMFIMRRDVFDRYSTFVFSVTEAIDQSFIKQGIQNNNRYLGYIAELLTNVFVMKHRSELKKAYVDMQILQTV